MEKTPRAFADYIERLQDILERIKLEQGAAIRKAGGMVAAALARGGVVHAFGTGHSHMVAEEAFYRAGGIVAVNPMLDERLAFFKGALESTRAEREEGYARTLIVREQVRREDVAILISNSGRNSVPVEMAMEMSARGVGVIAITNVRQSCGSASRHPSGKRLYELADVVIDTCVPEGDAVLSLPGLAYPMGPASTVAGAAIINSVIIEAAAALLENGQTVPVLPSANLATTTDEGLLNLLRPYSGRIRYLDAV
jgi:uncharacterized phosphosugar-binding protein